MVLKFENIITKLGSDKCASVRVKDPDMIYVGVRLLFGDEKLLDEKYIYVGKASRLPKDCIGKGAAFILEGGAEDVECLSELDVNYALLEPDMNIYRIHDVLCQCFFQRSSKDAMSDYLLESLQHSNGLIQILDASAKLLQNPVLLGLADRPNFIAARCYDFDDENARLTIEGIEVPLELCGIEERKEVQTLLRKNSRPFFYTPSNPRSKRRIFGNLVFGDRVFGNLLVIEENRPFTENDLDIAKVICEVLSIELMRSGNTQLTFLEGLLKMDLDKLLGEKPLQRDKMNTLLYLWGWNACSNFYAVNIDVSEQCNDTMNYAEFRRDVFETVHGSKVTRYGNRIILLANLRTAEAVDEFRSSLETLMKKYQAACGVSPCFHDLNQLKTYLSKSADALSIGRLIAHDEHVFDYYEYRYYIMLAKAAGGMDLNDVYDSRLEILLEHDSQQQTDYFKTLHEYYKSGRSVPLTAERLFIHKNTLKYRLNRISELLNADLNSENWFFDLSIAFLIKTYRAATEE